MPCHLTKKKSIVANNITTKKKSKKSQKRNVLSICWKGVSSNTACTDYSSREKKEKKQTCESAKTSNKQRIPKNNPIESLFASISSFWISFCSLLSFYLFSFLSFYLFSLIFLLVLSYLFTCSLLSFYLFSLFLSFYLFSLFLSFYLFSLFLSFACAHQTQL